MIAQIGTFVVEEHAGYANADCLQCTFHVEGYLDEKYGRDTTKSTIAEHSRLHLGVPGR